MVGHGDQISRSHNWNFIANHNESAHAKGWNSGNAALNDGHAEVDQGSRVHCIIKGRETDSFWGDSWEDHTNREDKGWEWVNDIVGNWGFQES